MGSISRRAMMGYFPMGGLSRRIVALPEHRCVYVKNLKAGCSTVSLWLHRIHTGEHTFVPDTPRHTEFRYPRPAQVGWDQIGRMLAGEAFRFTFVRDPIRRAESAYRDKLANTSDELYRDRVRAHLGLGTDEPVTPDRFVAALESQDPLEMDPHWRPQHLNLMHPLVEYDFVGRLEDFAAGLAHVREAVGLPEVPIAVRNATGGTSAFQADTALARRLRHVYARDYELYGY